MKLGIFELSDSDVALRCNISMEGTLAQLVNDKLLTVEQAEEFRQNYTFVAIRKTSVIDSIKKFLFGEKTSDDSYMFPLVKLRRVDQ